MDPEKRLRHAVNQAKYHKEKQRTHVRRQVWIPKSKIEDFKAAMKRLYKKWS